jgi:uncharacterized protein YndB with AHSA1/START domain
VPGGAGEAVRHEGPRVEHELRVAADPARVWSAWTEPSLIAGWFVERAVGRAEPGARVTWAWDYRAADRLAEWLDLGDRAVPGPVLVDAGPERLLAWPEIEGTLELKAFPVSGGGSMVGLRAMSWALPQAEIDRLQPVLEAAVDRLIDRLG